MNKSRRSFLYLAGTQSLMAPFAAHALSTIRPAGEAQAGPSAPAHTFAHFPASQITDVVNGMKGKKGVKVLVDGPPQPLLRIESEQNSIPTEFEYHEYTDHFFQVLDGKTQIELGGTPSQPHMTKPGEWRAPASPGSTSFSLSKGDILYVPHGTPHKRTTTDAVVIQLISFFIAH